jgi:molybdate transport system ATP-binding protein
MVAHIGTANDNNANPPTPHGVLLFCSLLMDTRVIDITALQHPNLNIPQWQLNANESWAVVGRNGSGKQWVTALFAGELANTKADTLTLPAPENVGIVSFEHQQRLFEAELAKDESDLTDEIDYGTPVRDFFPTEQLVHPLIDRLNLRHKLDSGYRQLSTGESRKVLIVQAVLNGAEVLICENPFDSLDVDACLALSDALSHISANITVLLLLNNVQDIPAWCQKIAVVEGGELAVLGDNHAPAVSEALLYLFQTTPIDPSDWPTPPFPLNDVINTALVNVNNLDIRYGDNVVFDGFSLRIDPLQHTLITGRNGSGKSTLMQLITGDCPLCYSNDVTVFGHRRGSGESIWDIKKHLGIVSAELHRNYRVRCDLLTVVCSGFFDSIGVYQQPDKAQIQHARHWLRMVGLASLANHPFQQCSYGEQRLALIARALVKSPLLLILDEPTQGLDSLNRFRVLQFIERITTFRHSTVVLVSHRQDEQLSLFKQHIDLDHSKQS